ncbi:hypothetical protein [Alteribacillus bidgolensis]|uniref:Uncharacterized protein n=1 Tax=Alteribacillus bidgolensis TaxID=930129 RepID=A0A1G8MQH0_9BACI|nr:hypothetical protein [Alteribacillus bidgolensis]SDI70116.1 hypothetical protein SAMN05216352_110144 [Alteribacillus bidgolensis]
MVDLLLRGEGKNSIETEYSVEYIGESEVPETIELRVWDHLSKNFKRLSLGIQTKKK